MRAFCYKVGENSGRREKRNSKTFIPPDVILSAAKNLFFQNVEILHYVQDDKK